MRHCFRVSIGQISVARRNTGSQSRISSQAGGGAEEETHRRPQRQRKGKALPNMSHGPGSPSDAEAPRMF